MDVNGHSQASVFRCPDGGHLRYSTAGSGEPVVLIHGFSLDRTLWDAQWPAVSARYRAVRYDLRGYGESSLPEGPYSHVTDLVALLEALDARPAHVVGLSMGGRVALQLALEAPAAVRSLTLVDSVLDGYPMDDAWSQRWRALVAAGKAGDVPQAKRLWLEHELFAPLSAKPDVATALGAMVERYSGWHWGHRDPGAGGARPALELLATVTAPTLVVVGEHDLPDFQRIARRLAADIPRATLEVVAGAGHVPNLEAADAFNAILLAHLDAHAGRGR
jgi:3-oxoadipate enol-lactonase